ncbi:MAG: hypothetical protein KDD47_21300 [Acidobacteria bacterium]|nr:hypothetical protein [Acidobacteriota bacterium]
MRLEGLIRFLFVVYCVLAGLLLFVAPWSPLWERILVRAPFPATVQLLSHTATRAAASGFGLVHLVWALNDLESFFLAVRPHPR